MDKDHEFWDFGKISVRSGWHFGELPIGSVHPFTGCICNRLPRPTYHPVLLAYHRVLATH